MAEGSFVEEPGIKKKKRLFDANFKLKVVDYAERITNMSAARKFVIDKKYMRDWRKKKADLQQIPAKRKDWKEEGARLHSLLG